VTRSSAADAEPQWSASLPSQNSAPGTAAGRTLICVTGLRGVPGVMGGVESHCEELLPRLAELDPALEIEVLSRQPYVPPGPREYRGIAVTPLPSPKGKSTEAIVATARAVLYARQKGAHVIHIHAIGPALMAPVARRLGMKVIFTHHGADYNRAKWGGFARRMLRAGEKFGIRSANAVIAVSPSLASDLKQRFPDHAGKIRYVPNGAPALPDDGDAEAVLSNLGVARDDYVLAVGRLVPEKGLHDLIAAHRRSGTAKKLLIVGGADHGSAYSRELQSQASPDVIFAGIHPRSVLKHLYENADRFVLPSFHEGLPIAALEAGSAGCPMILSDIQPNRDVGLADACYFEAGNVDALAAALSKDRSVFLTDPEFFRRTYDWDEIAARTCDIYRAVIGAK
jgi:glycosyltransferase involved in cell wall biosynthesis